MTRSSGRTPERPIDLVHLARQTLGNRDLEREVLRLFLGQSITLFARITPAEDSDVRMRAAHTIGGSALGIGAWRVARLAEGVERSALVPADAGRLIAELAVAIHEANSHIREILAD
jgi:HPt (histidine-containing phosphotransfer) domain-containing protein